MLLMTSSRDDSLSGSVRTLPCMHQIIYSNLPGKMHDPAFLWVHNVITLSHLQHSLSQLETRDVGQQMMMRLAMGVPPSSSWPFWSSVHSSVMPCSVFLWQHTCPMVWIK